MHPNRSSSDKSSEQKTMPQDKVSIWVIEMLKNDSFATLTLPETIDNVEILFALDKTKKIAEEGLKNANKMLENKLLHYGLSSGADLREIPGRIDKNCKILDIQGGITWIDAEIVEAERKAEEETRQGKTPGRRKEMLLNQKKGVNDSLAIARKMADDAVAELNELIKRRYHAELEVQKVNRLIDKVHHLIFPKLADVILKLTEAETKAKLNKNLDAAKIYKQIFEELNAWVRLYMRYQLPEEKPIQVEYIPTQAHEFAAYDENGRQAVEAILRRVIDLEPSQWTKEGVLNVLRNTRIEESEQIWPKFVKIITSWIANKKADLAKAVLIDVLCDAKIPSYLQTRAAEALIDPTLFEQLTEEKNFSQWLTTLPHEVLGNLVVKCLPQNLSRLKDVFTQVQEHISSATLEWRTHFITSFSDQHEFKAVLTALLNKEQLFAFLDNVAPDALNKVLDILGDSQLLKPFFCTLPGEVILKFLQNVLNTGKSARSETARRIFEALDERHMRPVLLAKEAKLFLLNADFINWLSKQSYFTQHVDQICCQLLLDHFSSVSTTGSALYDDAVIARLYRFIGGDSMAKLLAAVDDQIAKIENGLARNEKTSKRLRDELDGDNWNDESKKADQLAITETHAQSIQKLKGTQTYKLKLEQMFSQYFIALNNDEQTTFALFRYQGRFDSQKNLLCPFSPDQNESQLLDPLNVMVLMKLVKKKQGFHQQDEAFKFAAAAFRGIILYLLKGNLKHIFESDPELIKSVISMMQADELAFFLKQTHRDVVNPSMHQELIAEILTHHRIIALTTDAQFAELMQQSTKRQQALLNLVKELLANSKQRRSPHSRDVAMRVIHYISANEPTLISGDFYKLVAKHKIALNDQLLQKRLETLLPQESDGQDSQEVISEAYDLVKAAGKMPGANIAVLIDFYLRVTRVAGIHSDEMQFWQDLFAQQFEKIIPASTESPNWEQITFFAKAFSNGNLERRKVLLEFLPDNDKFIVLFLRALEGLQVSSVWKDAILNLLQVRAEKTLSLQIQGGLTLLTMDEVIEPAKEAVRAASQQLPEDVEGNAGETPAPEIHEEEKNPVSSAKPKRTIEKLGAALKRKMHIDEHATKEKLTADSKQEEKVSSSYPPPGDVSPSQLHVAETRLRGYNEAIKDKHNIKKLIENIGGIRKIAIVLHKKDWKNALPTAAVQAMASELDAKLLLSMCNATKLPEDPIMLKLLHKACGGAELVPLQYEEQEIHQTKVLKKKDQLFYKSKGHASSQIKLLQTHDLPKYQFEEGTHEYITDDQFKHLLAQFSSQHPDAIPAVLKLFESMTDISVAKQRELWTLRRFNTLKSKAKLNSKEVNELGAIRDAYANVLNPKEPSKRKVVVGEEKEVVNSTDEEISDDNVEPRSPRAVSPQPSPLREKKKEQVISYAPVAAPPKPAVLKDKEIKFHLPDVLRGDVTLHKLKKNLARYLTPKSGSSHYLFRPKNCVKPLSAEEITTHTFALVSFMIQNGVLPPLLNESLQALQKTPPFLSKKSKLSLLFKPVPSELTEAAQTAAVVLGYIQAICYPENIEVLPRGPDRFALKAEALKAIIADAAKFVALCRSKSHEAIVFFCKVSNTEEIITDEQFSNLLSRTFNNHNEDFPAVLRVLTDQKDHLSPGKKKALEDIAFTYQLDNPPLRPSAFSSALPLPPPAISLAVNGPEEKKSIVEPEKKVEFFDASCAGQILGWHNNCAFNCVAHTLLETLQEAELKEPLSPGYQEFLTAFSAYYCIAPIATLAEFRTIMKAYPNAADQEIILGPVLRAQLEQLTRGEQATADRTRDLLLSDASPLRYGFTQAVERHLLYGDEAKHEYGIFINSNQTAFKALLDEFKKYSATLNLGALSKDQVVSIRTYWKDAGYTIPEGRAIPPEDSLVALFMQRDETKKAIRVAWETGAYANYVKELNGLNQIITPGDLRPLCERFQFNLAVSRLAKNAKQENVYSEPTKLIVAPGSVRPTVALAYDGHLHFETLLADPGKAVQHNAQFPNCIDGTYYEKDRRQTPAFFAQLNARDDGAAQNEIRLSIALQALRARNVSAVKVDSISEAAEEALTNVNSLSKLDTSVEFRGACAEKITNILKAVANANLEEVARLKTAADDAISVKEIEVAHARAQAAQGRRVVI